MVEVDGVRCSARHVVIATGSDPVVPPIPGSRNSRGRAPRRHQHEAVPRRLLVLGGGPAGVELAQALHRLGGAVMLVEAAEQVLPRGPMASAPRSALRFGETASNSSSAGTRAQCAAKAATTSELDNGRGFHGDRLLVATGRRPRVGELGLKDGRCRARRTRHRGRQRLRAGEGVWAIGDVTGMMPLTYVGEYQAESSREHPRRTPHANYEAVPRPAFTDPQAAAVGATAARFRDPRLAEVSRLATYRGYTPNPTAS